MEQLNPWLQLASSLGPSGLLALGCYLLRAENLELKKENKDLYQAHLLELKAQAAAHAMELKALYAQLLAVMNDWRKALEKDDHHD